MIRGYYTALAGIVDAMNREAIVSDNIANANTAGFKETLATEGQFGFEIAASTGGAQGWIGTGVYTTNPRLDYTQGSLQESGTATDLALEGDGMFAVRTQTGEIGYTRAGNFKVDADMNLVTQQGYRVLDVTGQPIVLPSGTTTFSVAPDGTVGETGQRIAVLGYPASGVGRVGANLLSPKGGVTLITPEVRQGFLEMSNTDLGGAMTDLMILQRAVQLSSRALSLQDQTLTDAIGLGRLR